MKNLQFLVIVITLVSANLTQGQNTDTTTILEPVPFEYDNRLIKINATINDSEEKHDFILDSGAPTFITDTITKRYDLAYVGSETAYDADGNVQKIHFYDIPEIGIGNKKVESTTVASNEKISSMPILKGQHYAGLLGANAMKNHIWVINYNCREITLADDKETLSLPKNSCTAKMRHDEWGRPIISATLSGKERLSFIVDVGYNGSLLLPKKYFSKPIFNDTLSYAESTTLSTGFATGNAQMNYKFLNTISIGTLQAENVKSSTTGNNKDALIGNEFLENYIVVLDFLNGQLTFLPADEECKKNCC
ncbi:MAG TPA: aspartyl protease family protein [Bacteroidales bacterium]|nr:aspartyl protease family protein [Bacteroidales bacterium]